MSRNTQEKILSFAEHKVAAFEIRLRSALPPSLGDTASQTNRIQVGLAVDLKSFLTARSASVRSGTRDVCARLSVLDTSSPGDSLWVGNSGSSKVEALISSTGSTDSIRREVGVMSEVARALKRDGSLKPFEGAKNCGKDLHWLYSPDWEAWLDAYQS